MKINDKQIDDLCKFLGGLALAAAIGLAVGATGHGEDITKFDLIGLAVVVISCITGVLLLRKER